MTSSVFEVGGSFRNFILQSITDDKMTVQKIRWGSRQEFCSENDSWMTVGKRQKKPLTQKKKQNESFHL